MTILAILNTFHEKYIHLGGQFRRSQSCAVPRTCSIYAVCVYVLPDLLSFRNSSRLSSLSVQKRWYLEIQCCSSRRLSGFREYILCWALIWTDTRSASRKTRRCLETPGCVMRLKNDTNSPAERGLVSSMSSIARLVGSATAEKTFTVLIVFLTVISSELLYLLTLIQITMMRSACLCCLQPAS